MHQFDAGQDRAVILFHNVVKVFDLSNRDRYFALLVQLIQRCLVGAALVHCYLVGHSVLPYDFLEEAAKQVHEIS
jgi:hypothetical protein